ncbi:hypothetical protein MMC13_004210 [Lambiella insularis]|nr:hypothetical protein [Lambiella insularis]
MVLKLSVAAERDASRIAAIHMAAFGFNQLLQAQFPTAAIRDKLQISIADKALKDIQDPKTAVLVVRDQDDIISFAKWSLPVLESDSYIEPPWIWPEGTNHAVLDEWTEKVEAAKKKLLGQIPCFHLSFIGTDPLHERRGAASLLLKWGIEQCERHNAPAYLESTVDAAQLYERHDFKAAEKISMALDGTVEGMVNGDSQIVYSETCFLYVPSSADHTAETVLSSVGR